MTIIQLIVETCRILGFNHILVGITPSPPPLPHPPTRSKQKVTAAPTKAESKQMQNKKQETPKEKETAKKPETPRKPVTAATEKALDKTQVCINSIK